MELGVDEEMPILKKNKLSTGIPDLDIVMEGGYPNPANVIIIGPSGTEKAAFAYEFAGAAKEENAYIVCGSSSPADIIKKASTMGIDLNNVKFIDCYSSTLGKGQEQGSEKVTVVPGPSALNDISLALNEAINESAGKRMRVIFDTLSTFVLYNSKDSMKKFLSLVGGRLKNAQATTLYLIDEGVHDKQLLSLMEHGMDQVYTIQEKSGKFFFLLTDIGMELPVRAGPSGITVL